MLDIFPIKGCSLRLDESDIATGSLTISLAGDLDEPGARRLHSTVIDALRRYRPARIDIDLERVALCGPAGMRTLQLCRTDAAQVDCRIMLLPGSGADQRFQVGDPQDVAGDSPHPPQDQAVAP
jgi:anti-anti-sigma regulatory factor